MLGLKTVQSLEVMKTNHKWMEKNFEELSKWFAERNRQRSTQPSSGKLPSLLGTNATNLVAAL
jgi:hypothetical protein